MEDVGSSLFTPVDAPVWGSAGLLPGFRNCHPVTCERCSLRYTVTRLRPKRAKQRLCKNCRGTVAVGLLHAKYTTPISSKAERIRANGLVNKRLKLGWFTRPTKCNACGRGGRISGHHHDYTLPDQVRWLCHGCHIRAHIDPASMDAVPVFICYDRRRASPAPSAPLSPAGANRGGE